MTLNVRRVVTGLDATGKSTVFIDDIASSKHSGRPGHETLVLWASDRTPATVLGDEDPSQWVATRSPLPNGSIFRITEYGPGVQSRMHRNDSLDYSIVLSGEIDMRTEDGQEVHLKSGDVIIQRGTYHDWVNRTSAPCRIARILLDARPL